MPIRRTALVLLGVLPLLPGRGAGEVPACGSRRESPDPASCATCHPAFHDEWGGSRHAQAFTDPIYQAALRDLEHPERCHGCHAPEPVLARLGRPPRPRAEALEHGVHCASCHDDRGRIAGPYGAPTEAHESAADPAFGERGSVHLCRSCHDLRIGPVLPLARDFVAADLGARGKSCIGCHMPAVLRPIAVDPATGAALGGPRRGRSHALRGPGDPEFCAEAFKLGVGAADGRIEVAIGNRAGHRVPGLTTRVFAFRLEQQAADGRTLQQDEILISAENPLWVAETRRFGFRRADGAVRTALVGIHRASPTEAVEFVQLRREL